MGTKERILPIRSRRVFKVGKNSKYTNRLKNTYNEAMLREVRTKKLNNSPDFKFIEIYPIDSIIQFHIQNGPIKEYGENGCQISELGKMWLAILREFNNKHPCDENIMMMHHIGLALSYDELRTAGRKMKGIEGTDQS
jgi:galactose-1-phosphate uridylyltransferase